MTRIRVCLLLGLAASAALLFAGCGGGPGSYSRSIGGGSVPGGGYSTYSRTTR